jgi:hypothetical protein
MSEEQKQTTLMPGRMAACTRILPRANHFNEAEHAGFFLARPKQNFLLPKSHEKKKPLHFSEDLGTPGARTIF